MTKNSDEIFSFYKSTIIDPDFIFNSSSNAERNEQLRKESFFVVYDSTNHIRIMKHFLAPELLIEDKGIQNAWKKDGQNEFYLRMYLPKTFISGKSQSEKINHVIIMFNGLNEFENYYMYDTLGSNFAVSGYGAILLPTPYHLNRRILMSNGRPFKPSEYVFHNNYHMMYYYNYRKSIEELSKLIRLIRGIEIDKTDGGMGYYRNLFNAKETKITLFGFSLGGVKALGGMLDLHKPNKAKVHSCIIFNGAIGLERSDLTKIDRHPKEIRDSLEIAKQGIQSLLSNGKTADRTLALLYEWMCFTPDGLCSAQSFQYLTNNEKEEFTILLNLLNNNKKPNNQKTSVLKLNKSDSVKIIKEGIVAIEKQYHDNANCLHKILKWTSFVINTTDKIDDPRYKELEEELIKIASKCLFIQSGGDSAVSTNMLNHIVPKGGLHQIIIPGTEHNLETDTAWGDWLPKVSKYMMNFLSDEQKISQQELLTELIYILQDTTVFTLMKEFKRAEQITENAIGTINKKLVDGNDLSENEKMDLNLEMRKLENTNKERRQNFPLFKEMFSITQLDLLILEIEGLKSVIEQKPYILKNSPQPFDAVERFFQLYFTSKAYFPKFPELLEHVCNLERLKSIIARRNSEQ